MTEKKLKATEVLDFGGSVLVSEYQRVFVTMSHFISNSAVIDIVPGIINTTWVEIKLYESRFRLVYTILTEKINNKEKYIILKYKKK